MASTGALRKWQFLRALLRARGDWPTDQRGLHENKQSPSGFWPHWQVVNGEYGLHHGHSPRRSAAGGCRSSQRGASFEAETRQGHCTVVAKQIARQAANGLPAVSFAKSASAPMSIASKLHTSTFRQQYHYRPLSTRALERDSLFVTPPALRQQLALLLLGTAAAAAGRTVDAACPVCFEPWGCERCTVRNVSMRSFVRSANVPDSYTEFNPTQQIRAAGDLLTA
jgi:hypothetical protein